MFPQNDQRLRANTPINTRPTLNVMSAPPPPPPLVPHQLMLIDQNNGHMTQQGHVQQQQQQRFILHNQFSYQDQNQQNNMFKVTFNNNPHLQQKQQSVDAQCENNY